MPIENTPLEGLRIIRPVVHSDERGFVTELFRIDELKKVLGYDPGFVRALHSRSHKGVLRGMHAEPCHKLFYVEHGSVFSAIADIRPDSPTFGKVRTGILDDENRHVLYIPPGFANGFCALSEPADVTYILSAYYKPGEKKPAIAWNDPDLAIPWPIKNPTLSKDDRQHPALRTLFPHKFT